MTNQKEPSDKVLTKHDESIEPIITQIDVLKFPVFFVNESPEDFLGDEVHKPSKFKITRKGPIGGVNEKDLFHALVHLAKQSDFESDEIPFISRQLLQMMNWGVSGFYYRKLQKTISNLCDMKITIEGEQLWKEVQFFHNPTLWSSKDPEQESLFPSSVYMAKSLQKICKEGRLKAIHPYFFSLRRALHAKRLFELISSRASDHKTWKVDIFELRDLMPLEGKKYRTKSGIKQSICLALDRLKTDGIIFDYRFNASEKNSENLLIDINNDYFYSKKFPTKSSSESQAPLLIEDNKNHLTQMLVERGIAEKTACELVLEHNEQKIELQIEHIDFIREQAEQGRAKAPDNPSAFLIKAIKENYQLPHNFKSSLERKKDIIKGNLIEEAEYYLEHNELLKAKAKVEECLKIDPEFSDANRIFNKVTELIREQEKNEAVAVYVESLSSENLEKLHRKTELRLKQELKPNFLSLISKEGRKSVFYQSMFQTVVLEQYELEKQQTSFPI